MTDYLFVYGTLRPGLAPAEIAPAVQKLRLVGEGFVSGSLYDLGDYPGAILDPSSQRKIFGTVFELPEDSSLVTQFDEYEGFDPNAPAESLFLRTSHPVSVASGAILTCWVYVYNRKPETRRILQSGRYTGKSST